MCQTQLVLFFTYVQKVCGLILLSTEKTSTRNYFFQASHCLSSLGADAEDSHDYVWQT